MAIPDLHGSDDNADICLMYLARTRSASTKTEIRFGNQRSCVHTCSKNFALNLLLGPGRNGLFERDKKYEPSDSAKVCSSGCLALGIELM